MTEVKEYEVESKINTGVLKYAFVSKGKRNINKIIVYSKTDTKDYDLYNLGFGTLLDDGSIDDKDNTNNGDMYTVLYTVVNTVPLFFDKYPKSLLFITGSDPKRERAYPIFLERNFDVLTNGYDIFGKTEINGRFEKVQKGIKYKYFLVRKIS